MYIRASIILFMICLFLGCSVFKKDQQVSTNKLSNDTITNPISVVDTITPIDSSIVVNTDTIPTPVPSKLPLEYMTIEEKAMIDELNLLRADPNAYIQHIDTYLEDFMADPNWGFDTKQQERSAGEELIRSLRYMPPLDPLEPSEELYKVAKEHGQDMKERDAITHQGRNDSSPEERIQDSTSLVGSENLAAGGRSVRESVIMLLVDSNDRMSRSHRKTILNPAWKYTACYYAGTVSKIPGTWVQLFGFPDPTDIPVELPTRSLPDETEEQETTATTSDPNPSTTMASGDFSFMSADEKAMVDEINLMRGNPKGYIQYVDTYIAEMKKMMMGEDPDFDKASNELKSLLKTMPKLSILKPHPKLYEVAKAHGLDNKTHNQLEHKGSDGRQSFDRVKDAGLSNSINNKGVYAPNENLVGGESNARNSVIALLIDAGISTRGHRKALIEPTWQFVACYKIGTIEDLKDLQGMGLENDDMSNCWVQVFAIP